MVSTTEPRLQADVGCSNHIASSHQYSALQSVRDASIVGDYSPRSFRAAAERELEEETGIKRVYSEQSTKGIRPRVLKRHPLRHRLGMRIKKVGVSSHQ